MASTEVQQVAEARPTGRQGRFLPWRSRSNTASSPTKTTFFGQPSQPMPLPNLPPSRFEQARAKFERFEAPAAPRVVPIVRPSTSANNRPSPREETKEFPQASTTSPRPKPDETNNSRPITSPATSPTKSRYRSKRQESSAVSLRSRSDSAAQTTTASSSLADDASMRSEASSHVSHKDQLAFHSAASSVDVDDRDGQKPTLALDIDVEPIAVPIILSTAEPTIAPDRPSPPLPQSPPPPVPVAESPSVSIVQAATTEQQRPATAHAALNISVATPSPSLSVEDSTNAPRMSFGTVSNITSVVYKGHTLDRSPTAQSQPTPSTEPMEISFPVPPTTRQNSKSNRLRIAVNNEETLDLPDKPLPRRPTEERRSLSADGPRNASRFGDVIESPAYFSFPKSVTSASSPDIIDRKWPATPGLDTTQTIVDSMRDLNLQSSTQHERYTALRNSRQTCQQEMLTALQDGSGRSKNGKSALQLQLDITNLDSEIDQCMAKLAQIEKQRQRLTDELLRQLRTRPESPRIAFALHGRQESVGIKEMISSPTSAKTPLNAGLLSPTSAKVNKQKDLPLPPRQESRISAVSLSLANVMDFLDSTEDPEVF